MSRTNLHKKVTVNYTVNSAIRTNKKAYGPNGELINFDVPIARSGIFEYRGFEIGFTGESATRMFKVYRPLSAFEPSLLKSFANLPVTDDHPDSDVDTENFRQLAVGMTGDQIYMDGSYMNAGKVIVYDKKTIEGIESGKKCQLSIGFNAVFDFGQPGISEEGEPYDGIEIPIKANHLGVVTAGKAGDRCILNSEDMNMPVNKKAKNEDDIKKDDDVKNEDTKKDKDEVVNAVNSLSTKIDTMCDALTKVVNAIAKNSDIEEIGHDGKKDDVELEDGGDVTNSDDEDEKVENGTGDDEEANGCKNSDDEDEDEDEDEKAKNKKHNSKSKNSKGLNGLINSANALQHSRVSNSSGVSHTYESALSVLDNF